MQRWYKRSADQRAGPKRHAKKLKPEERALVLKTACEEDYYDHAPAVIVAKLADEGKYIASEKTFYRVLKAEKLLAHRSRAKKPVRSEKLPTVASKPNEVWCWDITNMRTPYARTFFKLYMFQDIYSRKIVGWQVHEREDDLLATQTFMRSLANENITGEGLRIHSDNGLPMRGASMLNKFLDLGVRPSFSRPHVSNDNPFIESLFKTMKYSPSYPTKPFKTLEAARTWVEGFVASYNDRMHSSLNLVTPNQRHEGVDSAILEKRQAVFENARNENPERWVGKVKQWQNVKIPELTPQGTRMLNQATTL